MEEQAKKSFSQWYFDLDSVRSPIYFPNNEITQDTFKDFFSNPQIAHKKFNDETFMEFINHEYVHAEVLLSTDNVEKLFEKHLHNIDAMIDYSKTAAYRLARQKKTRAERLNRIIERRHDLEVIGSSSILHKTTINITSDATKSECEVSDKRF